MKSTIAATAVAAGLIGLTSCATREAVAIQRPATAGTASITATTIGRRVDVPATTSVTVTPTMAATPATTVTATTTTTVLSTSERIRITWDWAGGVEGDQHPEIKDCVIGKTLARWPDFPEHAHSAHGEWPAAPQFNEIRTFRLDCIAAISPSTTTTVPQRSAAERNADDVLDATFRAGAAQAGRTLTDNQVFCMREATKRDARVELIELAAGQALTPAEVAHLQAIWDRCL